MTNCLSGAKEHCTMVEYWIKGDDGEEYGPATLEELAEWAKEDRAGLGTQVRTTPEGAWLPWQSYPELMALLSLTADGALFPGVPGLQLGSILARLAAYLFDMMAIGFMMVFPAMLVIPLAQLESDTLWKRAMSGMTPTPEQAYLLLIGMVIYVAYFTFFHGRTGQTPGKKLFRLRVVDAHGLTISYRQAFLRAIGSFLSQQVLFIGHYFALVTPRRQAFHDMAARSFVVRYTGKN